MLRSRLLGTMVVAFVGVSLAASHVLGADEAENSRARPRGEGMEERTGLSLLQQDVVAKDLNLTDEQKESLKKVGEDAKKQMSELRESLKNTPRKEREAKRTDAAKEIAAKVDAVLDAKQLARLEEIKLQMRGTDALNDDKIQDALKVTEDQEQSLKSINSARRRSIKAAIADAGGDRKAAGEKIQQIAKDSNEKLLAVLTPEQREQFEKMQGKKIDLGNAAFGSLGGPGRRSADSDSK